MELLYIWIKKLPSEELVHEYTFTPEYDIEYKESEKRLIINQNNNINIFRKNNIVSVCSVVGENGVGKTTLLNFILSLSKMYKLDLKSGINVKENREYIAVYLEDSEIVVVNYTSNKIIFKDNVIAEYSVDKTDEICVSNCSHIYISASEYGTESNLKEGRLINHTSLTNKSMNAYSKSYYTLKSTLSNFSMSRIASKFIILQSLFTDLIRPDSFQSLLYISYYGYVRKQGKEFLGKKINTVFLKIKNIDSYINDDIFSTLDYPTIKYNSEDITEFVVKIKDISNLKKMNQNNPLYVLIFNLLGELTYTYDDFKIDNWESLEGILEECDKYIYSLKNINHEIHDVEYFKIALKEIKEMKKLICKETIIFKNGKYEVSISDLDKTIKTLMKNKYSFLLKYISISNLYMSSGEETILNMMSRILFLSQLDLYFKKEDYKLRDNILLLIDEIDLYLHPEWQRKILSTLIKELNNCFPNHMFQIILTSHSPIVLSDIPTQNCIFLKRENEKVINVEKVSQTFGSSIYNLYKDAFFLENGLATGEFAKKYINCLAKEIKELQISKEETINENFDDIEKRIDLIGEPIIRKQLRKMLHESTKAFKPLPSEEKNEVIQFLEQQKRMLEFQIKKLKESNYD